MRTLNDRIECTQKKAFTGLPYSKFEKANVDLKVHSNVLFSRNGHLSSQLSVLVLIFDSDKNAHIIRYYSQIFGSVVRPTMDKEVAAIMKGFS